jgi:hypothetical protein
MIDQALGLEAAEDLGDSAAFELEGVGQRQDREIVALRGGDEDRELGIAEPGHGMISVVGGHQCPPYQPEPRRPEPRGAGSGDREC